LSDEKGTEVMARQAGLFPTLHDGWPPVITPQYPQNPIVASSRDPNNEDTRMQVSFSGLAAGGYRAPLGRMMPIRRPATDGRRIRALSAASLIVNSGAAAKLGLRGLGGPCGNGLNGPCEDHTAQDWANAMGEGLQVFGQVATSIGSQGATTTNGRTTGGDAGWRQAGSISTTVGTGVNTITSGLCNQAAPAQTFVGSENDMQNQINQAKAQTQPSVPTAGYGAAAPAASPSWVPWAVGGGVAAAAIVGLALFLRH
jgi:hypothetical protein